MRILNPICRVSQVGLPLICFSYLLHWCKDRPLWLKGAYFFAELSRRWVAWTIFLVQWVDVSVTICYRTSNFVQEPLMHGCIHSVKFWCHTSNFYVGRQYWLRMSLLNSEWPICRFFALLNGWLCSHKMAKHNLTVNVQLIGTWLMSIKAKSIITIA